MILPLFYIFAIILVIFQNILYSASDFVRGHKVEAAIQFGFGIILLIIGTDIWRLRWFFPW